MVKIVVIGGGIIGLSSAFRIKEKYPNFNVTIVAEKLSPNTTGDGSGGLWTPYLCGNNPATLLRNWSIETYDLLHKLWQEGGRDVMLMPIYILCRHKKDTAQPIWASDVFGYSQLNEEQLAYYSKLYSGSFVQGQTYITLKVVPTTLLTYFLSQLRILGVTIIETRVSSLEDSILQGADVVINCTGLGARSLVNDEECFPIRGQILRVKADWINETIFDEEKGNYIIPNGETCVIGGTHQENDYNTKSDPNDTEFITEGCSNIIPAIKDAEVISNWVGLRPGRNSVRIEKENVAGKTVIHNYGHGGSGFTLFWGCASQVVNLLEEELKNNPNQMYIFAKL